MKNINVLILDDEKKITERIAEYLKRKPFEVFCAFTPSQAFEILNMNKIDIIIIDVLLPEMDGLEVLGKIKKQYPEIEAIMISGHGNMDMTIKAMQKGAVDFLNKPFTGIDLQLAIERTSRYLRLQNKFTIEQNKNSLITRELENLIEKEFIGKSNVIRDVISQAVHVGKESDINALIVGENGTGKEIIARIIHFCSDRKDKIFYPINSTAIPETLLESEFFGHRRGAFTDAKESRKGYFELTDGGSLFLDEIADMPYSLQAKLLRALEEKKIKPVGGDKEFSVDIRIISATNKDIEKLVDENKFRIDLYHRINNFVIQIPPLRQRVEDIEPLIYYFIEMMAKKKNRQVPIIKSEVIDALKYYHFPGNVRELRNMIERAFILSTNNVIDLSYFSFVLTKGKNEISREINLNLMDNEILLIKNSLMKTEYNQQQASRLLGISRDSLIRRMKKYKIRIDKKI